MSKTNPFEYEDTAYVVLINAEAQYSLWPDPVDIPPGWTPVGPRGTRQVCLSWIDREWTDMRPASLRKQMERTVQPGDRPTP
jgi:uncharacterized protein YbdZ (MbtH family)